MNYKFLFDCKRFWHFKNNIWIQFNCEHDLVARDVSPPPRTRRIWVIYCLMLERPESSQRQIRSAEMGLQREKEDTCVITCVCAVLMCLTRNMLTHNRDFGPVQTNQCYATLWCIPGRALLKQPARSTGTKAKPRDKSGNPQTKGDVVMHDMLLQNRVSVFYFMFLHE